MRTRVVVLALASVLAAASFGPRAARADEGALPDEARAARAHVDASLAQMRATSLRVREQLRAARKRGTAHQIACVDEALSRSDVALRRAREHGDEAMAAYGRGDVDAARAALRRVAEVKESQRSAAATGTSCAPGAVVRPMPNGTTTVTLQVSPTIAPAP